MASGSKQEQGHSVKSHLFFGYFGGTSPPSNSVHSTAASPSTLPFRLENQIPATTQIPQHTLQHMHHASVLALNSAGVYN